MTAKPRLFLTGGGGMVGRNVLDHAAAAGWEILAPRSRDLDLTDAAAVGAVALGCCLVRLSGSSLDFPSRHL